MEKMNITLTQDEMVMELIRLLKENQMKDKANDIFESAIYVDGLEKKLDQVATELNAVKKQLDDLQEQQMMKSIKAQLANASERMEALCNSMKEQLFEVKTEFKEKATSIVTEVKAKGKEGLNRISEFFGVKEKLKKLRMNVREAGIETDKTIVKIDLGSRTILHLQVQNPPAHGMAGLLLPRHGNPDFLVLLTCEKDALTHPFGNLPSLSKRLFYC